MLVICEDCAKKYNIDEHKMQGQRARFSCQECGHIIVVQRPGDDRGKQPDGSNEDKAGDNTTEAKREQPQPEQSEGKVAEQEKKTEDRAKKTKRRGKGFSIGFYLLLALSIGFISIAAALAFLYFKYIPQIINEQVVLRTSAITTIFAGSVQQPLLDANYPQVNKEVNRVSQLPGVAYAAVVNKKGIVVAGLFNDLSNFDQVFAARVKAEGFPREVIEKNPLEGGVTENFARFVVGGQMIQDKGLLLQESGGAVHIGTYISEVDHDIYKALFSPLSLSIMGALFFGGVFIFFLIARSISKPLIELTDVVNRISLGELDLTVDRKGPSEVRELAAAFERMRYSIKAAIGRLKK